MRRRQGIYGRTLQQEPGPRERGHTSAVTEPGDQVMKKVKKAQVAGIRSEGRRTLAIQIEGSGSCRPPTGSL